jgi:hypothetical protein
LSNRSLKQRSLDSSAAVALLLALSIGLFPCVTRADAIDQRATVFDGGGGLLRSPNYLAVVTFGEALVHPPELTNFIPIVSPGYIAQVKLIRHMSLPSSVEAGLPVYVNRLQGGYPNPFNPVTTVRLSLASDGLASLVVYDIGGRKVRELVSGSLLAGVHDIPWNGRRDDGSPVGSGIYFVRLTTKCFVDEARLVLLK